MTCRSRSSRSGVAVLASFLLAPAAAQAAELPPIRSSASNPVADCATPGRLTHYLQQRNPKLDPRYETLAAEYMRHGEALQVRWDYAFFQMILETGYLNYGGDVKPDQNNFAGLGATGKGARGERFPDISTGVRAHIEHLVMYSGDRVENPVAERTRNIQEWGVLTDWQKGISGPITFSQLAKKWAPGSRRYVSDIETIAQRFFDGPCKEPDPYLDVIAARGDAPSKTRSVEAKAPVASQNTTDDAVRVSPGTADGPPIVEDVLPSKGAAAVAAAASEPKAKAQTASVTPPVTLLNPAPAADTVVEPAAASEAEAAAAAQSSGKAIEVAALPGALKGAGAAETKPEAKPEKKKPEKKDASGKCRVWTASYGGSKAIIIKAVSDKTINYTVLDVNEGAEKREADAYINAYAKGGQSVGEFASQSQALEKAFELCPEG
ncbi:glucosaminidase domain-containing protein [Hyphomicrobium sp.]|uniref:glucosaminidase domain-containing protein n=1 Tax=Hyphomicrobium sp. TaxID=82 RepID=UPI0025B815D0|nr:glucosaminidase domain-containing protein [Hyphomicrobium sp.]MCC7253428.1 glucosaminidase domain-containing protein [Hyphomicrobium sp.]